MSGCGGDDDASSSSDTTAAAAATAADAAVTIEHAFGSTTIDGRRARIVTLGLQWADVLLALDEQPVGYIAEPLAGPEGAYISLEQASFLDGDLLVIFSNDGDPHDLVGYDQLSVVTGGATAELDVPSVVGFNTPTPLSIPYSLELVRPALAAAAA